MKKYWGPKESNEPMYVFGSGRWIYSQFRTSLLQGYHASVIVTSH